MKKEKITFLPIDGSGAVHIDFAPGPFGDATEANKGDGIGFFDPKGNLLGVTFDDVLINGDHQILVFDSLKIEVNSKKGKITYKILEKSKNKKAA
jgi:hypothetical protein